MQQQRGRGDGGGHDKDGFAAPATESSTETARCAVTRVPLIRAQIPRNLTVLRPLLLNREQGHLSVDPAPQELEPFHHNRLRHCHLRPGHQRGASTSPYLGLLCRPGLLPVDAVKLAPPPLPLRNTPWRHQYRLPLSLAPSCHWGCRSAAAAPALGSRGGPRPVVAARGVGWSLA